MRMRRTQPLFSLLALAAIAGALLALAPASTSKAQMTSYPGENDPISGRADALSQFADDELALVSDAPSSTSYAIDAFSPNPDYTLPDGIASDALPKPPPGNLVPYPGGNPRQFAVARGRVVDPARDVAVALTRTGYSASPNTLTWTLQELSFGANHPATPPTVPTLTWSAPVNDFDQMAAYSPGALALGDLDRVADTKGQPHDEIVLVYEAWKRTYYQTSALQLSVQRYDPQSGKLVQSVAIDAISDDSSYMYLCGISWVNKTNCPEYHPGIAKLALADVDGDGYQEIALLAHTRNPSFNINQLELRVFSYCPPGLAADDPRVVAKYCSAQVPSYSLALRSTTLIASGVNTNASDGTAMFYNPAELVAGDFDGDGVADLAVVHTLNQRYIDPSAGEYKYLADVMLSILAWTVSDKGAASLPVVWETPHDKPVATMNSWFDRDNPRYWDPPIHYHDLRIAAGLFRFAPELDYTFSRRQIALAYAPAKETLQLDLWDITSPNTPMANPPKQWTATSYHKPSTIPYCGDSYAAFGLVAGNWAGVKLTPSNPLWGLAVSYETQPDIQLDLYRVDQKVDPKTGIGPLTLAASKHMPKFGTDAGACGQNSRNELMAFDFDGDSLQFGPPLHIVLQVDQSFDYILQEPPQHLDYFPKSGGMQNVSRTPKFNVSYGSTKSQEFSTRHTNSSDWNIGVGNNTSGTVGYKEGIPFLENYEVDVSVSNRFNYDYDSHKEDYAGTSDIYTSTLTTQTSGGDALQFRAKVIDIWRYPIYGLPPQDKDQPYSYYELALPRANSTPAQNMDDLNAQTYGYQPQHENGNALSYPAVPAGQPFAPADLGPWLLSPSMEKVEGAVPCENNTRWCITVPVSEAAHQFDWGRTASSQRLAIDHSKTTGNTRSWNHKLKDTFDAGVTVKGGMFGGEGSVSTNFELDAGGSWGEASTTTLTSLESTELTVNIPSSQDQSNGYHFNPLMYITDNGTIKVGSGTGFDNAGSFWTDNYHAADPALNLPRKFNQPSSNNPNIIPPWEINKDWTEARQLRGTWLRSTKLNPVTKTYDVVDGVQVGSKVFFDARVYNYSVATPVKQTEVQLSLEPVDPQRNYVPTGKCITITSQLLGPIPYHGQTDQVGTKVLDNFVPARFELDTTNLLPAGRPSATYRVWLVLDPSDPGNSGGQTHGWRQPNVILTPIKSAQAGTTLSMQLQDAAGSVLDTVSYTSKGTDDPLAAGLVNALNNNQHVSTFGATAQLQDTTTSTNSIVLYKAGTQPPTAHEARAGIVDGNRALYVVPVVGSSGVPMVTATNLEYGQNNEGWGLLTVFAKQNDGPMLGADNYKLSSSGNRFEGRDIRLARNSLAAMPAQRRTDGSKVVVRAGERVPMRVTAFTDGNWAGFERVTVFQGDPADGIVAGTTQIRGISGDRGGYSWFTWKAPLEPGTYELVAQLQHSWYDPAPENNVASVEVVVEAGPKLPHRTFLGAISRAEEAEHFGGDSMQPHNPRTRRFVDPCAPIGGRHSGSRDPPIPAEWPIACSAAFRFSWCFAHCKRSAWHQHATTCIALR